MFQCLKQTFIMAVQKYKCPNCKRAVESSKEFCPYCSTPNPFLEQEEDEFYDVEDLDNASENTANENFYETEAAETVEWDEDGSRNDVQNMEDDDPFNMDDDALFDDPKSEADADNDADIEEFEEYTENDEFEEDFDTFDDENNEVLNEDEDDFNIDSDPEPDSAVEAPSPAKKIVKHTPAKHSEVLEPESGANNTNRGTINQNIEKRAKIDWEDEKKNEPASTDNMFDENGVYNANYDGYYNDTLPKIANEVDNLLKDREKAILKAVAAVVAVFGVIVYLILTI